MKTLVKGSRASALGIVGSCAYSKVEAEAIPSISHLSAEKWYGQLRIREPRRDT